MRDIQNIYLNVFFYIYVYIYRCVVFARENLSKFNEFLPDHAYQTRSRDIWVVPRHGTSLFRRSPEFACIQIYNQLPDQIRNVATIKGFKMRAKEYLTENCFYNLHEYGVSET